MRWAHVIPEFEKLVRGNYCECRGMDSKLHWSDSGQQMAKSHVMFIEEGGHSQESERLLA